MFNPNRMRWDCSTRGCFNIKKRPKIEIFSDCLPGRINFGDVDGMVEVNNHFLFLEWQEAKDKLARGQEIAHRRLTAGSKSVVLNICGDAEAMTVTFMRIISRGEVKPWEQADLDKVRWLIRKWVAYAQGGGQ